MRDAVKLLLSLSLSGSVLILLMFALRPLLKERLSKSWQYYLWIIVLLRLVVPYTPNFSLENIMFQKDEMQHTGVTGQYAPGFGGTAQIETDKASDGTEPATVPVIVSDNSVTPLIVWDLAGYIWLTGTALMLLFKVVQYARFSRKLRSSAEIVIEQNILTIFMTVAEEIGIKAAPAVFIGEQIQSPMLVGLKKPVIMLPFGALGMSEAALRYMFKHELTHMKRKDILLKWFAEIIGCIHWFNPLVYVMVSRISRACELSCDEAVARDLDENAKISYGNTLLEAAAGFGISGRRVLSTTLYEDKKSLKERLSAILNASRKSRKTIMLSIIVALSLTTAAVLLGGCSAVNSSDNGNTPSNSPAPTTSASPDTTPSTSATADGSPAISGTSPSPTGANQDPALPADKSPSATTEPTETDGIVYKNTQYGFNFHLPKNWGGYTIIVETWEGTTIEAASKVQETGPKLSIRNPKWSSKDPMQDIPIMIFTLDQWAKLLKGEFAVSAAPIGPNELGRNSKYVFALPARYNFSYLTGYEEVEDIMKSGPLYANESIGK